MRKMMKILFLNPRIDAEHKISKALRGMGAALLFPADIQEALQMFKLHGSSVDLAVIQSEGEGWKSTDIGPKFIAPLKADPAQADLPLIITTESWSDAECAQHQEGPQGANAYLREPFTDQQLIQTIEAVMGQSISSQSQAQTKPKAESHTKSGSYRNGPVLEDASVVFLRPEESSGPLDQSIVLQAPEVEPSVKISKSIENAELSIPTAIGNLELSLPTVISPSQDSGVDISELEAALEARAVPESSSFKVDDESLGDIPGNISGDDLLVPDQVSDSISGLEMESVSEVQELGEESKEDQQIAEDPEVAQEMPYLFSDDQKRTPVLNPALLFAEPLGDAVVPGGAAQTPDLETFKKYLLLREQDVAVLSNQLKVAQDQTRMLEQSLREEKAKNAELIHTANEQTHKIQDFEKEKNLAIEGLQSEIEELHFQVKAKNDKVRLMEHQVREVTEEMEHLKDRVRMDIRKIRVREKELENRLEIIKKDSEALIGARENKIIELKRKLDLLEFNMDLLQDQYGREKEVSSQLRDRLSRAAQIVRAAGGLLDSPKEAGSEKDRKAS